MYEDETMDNDHFPYRPHFLQTNAAMSNQVIPKASHLYLTTSPIHNQILNRIQRMLHKHFLAASLKKFHVGTSV